MMHDRHIDRYLDEYIDNKISDALRNEVDEHLRACSQCRDLLSATKQQLADLHGLTRSIALPRDLWPSIEAHLKNFPREEITASHDETPRGINLTGRVIRFAAVLAILVIGAWVVTTLLRRPDSPWHVTAIEGNPRIGNAPVGEKTSLRVGDWIRTDARSRARIGIDSIGQIDVASGTALRFVEASNRRRVFSLAVGEIHAKVNAPPRLFVVETPAVQAVDLGCDYTLHADSSGECMLEVYFGWVELASGNRRAEVPAGYACLTRPGFGPGTPYSTGSSDTLRHALAQLDFDQGGAGALHAVLNAAQQSDALTLWHLLFRVDRESRNEVYDRLAILIKPPGNVTREGFLAGDSSMIMAWQERLELDADASWRFR